MPNCEIITGFSETASADSELTTSPVNSRFASRNSSDHFRFRLKFARLRFANRFDEFLDMMLP